MASNFFGPVDDSTDQFLLKVDEFQYCESHLCNKIMVSRRVLNKVVELFFTHCEYKNVENRQ